MLDAEQEVRGLQLGVELPVVDGQAEADGLAGDDLGERALVALARRGVAARVQSSAVTWPEASLTMSK